MATAVRDLGPRHDVEVPDGVIRYHETGEGPPIVFVHGIIANADVWRGVVVRLRDRYRCITPDWPLGGHTVAMRPGTDFTLFGLADLVQRTITALGLNRPALVGNDTGGAICQAVAARHPEKIGPLVLTPSDAFDNFLPLPIRHLQVLGRTPAGLRVLGEALRLRPVQRLPIAFGLLTRRPIPADIMASYTGPLRANPGTRQDFAYLVRAISPAFTLEAAEGLRTFPNPALIAWARQRFFPLAHGERLAGLIPDARLRIIEGSGPFVTEDQPHQTAALIDEFLRASHRN